MNSLAGYFLIADPRLDDPNFFRSVVLITIHSDDGATGVILNRQSDMDAETLWPQISESVVGENRDVFLGGPVSGMVSAIHDFEADAELEVIDGVFVSMARNSLDSVIARSGGQCRLFMGYAGWAGGQLESELDAGGWLVMPATSELIFGEPDGLYKAACEVVNHSIVFSGASPPRAGSDPSSN